MKYTHKGWFYLCPVYIANPYSESPTLEARRGIPELWFSFNEFLFACTVVVLTMIVPGYEPMFAIRITGEIK